MIYGAAVLNMTKILELNAADYRCMLDHKDEHGQDRSVSPTMPPDHGCVLPDVLFRQLPRRTGVRALH